MIVGCLLYVTVNIFCIINKNYFIEVTREGTHNLFIVS